MSADKTRADRLAAEFRSTMTRDVLLSWAVDAQNELRRLSDSEAALEAERDHLRAAVQAEREACEALAREQRERSEAAELKTRSATWADKYRSAAIAAGWIEAAIRARKDTHG